MIRILKKFFSYLIITALLVLTGAIIVNKFPRINRPFSSFAKPCQVPLKYSIGAVDPRFNVTEDQLREIVSQAEAVWGKASGRDLFEYDPNGSLKIQLVYDERQQGANEASQLKIDLKALDVQQARLDAQYGGLDKKYDQGLADFKDNVSEHEKNLKDYNKIVDYWNKKGGAPEDIYKKLKKTQQDLSDDYATLKNQESDLKKIANQINIIAAQENKIVKNYNAAVITYQNKYGGSQEFEKGVYDPAQGISIYQFQGADDLRLTIVHELAHALGFRHVENSKSIMYYLMGEQDLENPTPTAEDMAELKNICKL